MFQFQGGVSDGDKEKILSGLLKKRHIIITDKNRVQYPEQPLVEPPAAADALKRAAERHVRLRQYKSRATTSVS